MCEELDKVGIEREFVYAVQALARKADDQIASQSPGCVTCELYEGFNTYYPLFLSVFESSLSETHREALSALRTAIAEIPECDCVCFDNAMLERESWQGIRRIARRVLDTFRWPNEPPPSFCEAEPDVWNRL